MNITVAGAGAGKTTSMAKKVLDRHKEIGSRKIIYVVTYTNAARDRIREKVIEENGSIPNQVCIETYHSFLLKEFIFPFHHILYQSQYIQATQITLSDNNAFKNIKIKELEASGQIHVEKVTEVAKWIIYGKSTDRKIHKQNREKILSIITNYLDAVFVDEAQDIDEHLSQIIEALDQKNLHVALVGDPKQDLRGRNTFRKLIQKYPEHTLFLEDNHRCPISHVSLTNKFVDQKERQIPRSDQQGTLKYLYEQDVEIEDVLKRECWDHVFILKKMIGLLLTLLM
ncbi:UvrD-helicase domain-containing protein [Paenibacillus odorifer]|uniref:UvrD-helicase domain-containing protein n=1 Tax=Paenibacillus odorifer TaxID=189426 RepID=UPI00289CE0B4|nr:UvrD-helicase domain-containing protein [Paenibacillus odorifer]